ncbi:Uncharacterized protein C0J52_09908 [Blattella germanica]|nr:Uncharacterized protein C0J52_09908 [Blattella germanica]
MKVDTYNAVMTTIRSFKGSGRNCETLLKKKFPEVTGYTLGSIYSLEYQRRMKRNHQKFSRITEELFERFQREIASGEDVGILLRIADEIGLSPALLARMILEKHYERNSEYSDEPGNLCGRRYGCSLGQEYELRLQRKVRDLNLAFRDEEHLRLHGYDKTPDIKLEIPIAVDGFVVNWIESKALFGDEEGHAAYFKDQYRSYWNRFGPGLVIYWFGYIETLERKTEKCIIIRDDFPTNITVMNPRSIEPNCVQVK